MRSSPPALRGLLPILVLAALSLSACEPASTTDRPAAAETEIPVRVSPVASAAPTLSLSFPGVLRARERSRVAPQVSGQLLARPVRLGQRVGRGDLLAVLDNPGLGPSQRAASAEVDALSTRVEQARMDLQRAQQLRERGLQSADAVEQADTVLRQLQANRQQALAQLEAASAGVQEQSLRAPHQGVITRVFAEPGDFLAVGQPLLEISNSDALELPLHVPAQYASSLVPGTRLTLTRLYDGLQVDATVAENALAAAGGGGLVELLVVPSAAAPLHSGEAMEAALSVPGKAGSRVPLSALRAVGGAGPSTVLLYSDGKAQRVQVEVLALLDDDALLADVLPPDSRVIVAAPSTLMPGDRVRALP